MQPMTAMCVSELGFSPVLEWIISHSERTQHRKEECRILKASLQTKTFEQMVIDLDQHLYNGSTGIPWSDFNTLCDLFEEAEYVILSCAQLQRHQILARLTLGKQICAVAKAFDEFATKFQTPVSDSLGRLQSGTGAEFPFEYKQSNKATNTPVCTAHDEKVFQHMDILGPAMLRNLVQQRSLGIVGRAGIGKTTLAMALHNQVLQGESGLGFQFEHIEVVSGGTLYSLEGSDADQEIVRIQSRVWHSLRGQNSVVPFTTPEQGVASLAGAVENKAVLLVLDDICHRRHLELLNFATYTKYSDNTRVIVTTRDASNLDGLMVDGSLFVEEPDRLTPDNAARLLCLHAFGDEETPASHEEVVEQLVVECDGLPLTLSLLGASLKGDTSPELWLALIKKLQAIDQDLTEEEALIEKCRPSFEALPPHQQHCFIDFAAYPKHAMIPKHELLSLWSATAPVVCPDRHGWAQDQLQEMIDRQLISQAGAKSGQQSMTNCVFTDDSLYAVVSHAARESTMFRYEPRGKTMTAPAISSHHIKISPSISRSITMLTPGGTVQGGSVRQVSYYYNRDHRLRSSDNMLGVRMLYLQGNQRHKLSDVVCTCTHLQLLSLADHTEITSLPKNIGNLLLLQVLDLTRCIGLTSLPSSFESLVSLRRLNITACNFESLDVSHNTALRVLVMQSCDKLLDLKMGQLPFLRDLDVNGCSKLSSISYQTLPALTTLNVSGCDALAPMFVEGMLALNQLEWRSCKTLQSLDVSIMFDLKSLDLSGCTALTDLNVRGLFALTRLVLSQCKELNSLDVTSLSAVRTLDMSQCASLETLEVAGMDSLIDLDLSECSRLVAMDVSTLTALEKLSLRDCCRLGSLDVNGASALETLNLADCSRLRGVSMKDLEQLKSLDVTGCAGMTVDVQSLARRSITVSASFRPRTVSS